MGNEYKVYNDENVKITLLESSCKFTLMIDGNGKVINDLIDGCFDTEKKLTVNEMLDVVCNVMGPLHYFEADGGESLLGRLEQKLKERGFR